MIALAAFGAGGNDQRVGALAVQHDEFLAVDHVTVAFLLRRGRDVVEVVARVLLQLRKGKGLAAVDDAGNMRGLLRVRRAVAQKAAGDHDGRQVGLQHHRLAERLHHDHGLDRAGAKAAIGFRERQAQQALLGELAPDGLAPAALLLLIFLARIEIVGVGQETVDAFLEKALLLGQIKIHVRYFLQITKFSPSCPGLSRASTSCFPCVKTWMAGSSPAMTTVRAVAYCDLKAPAPPW